MPSFHGQLLMHTWALWLCHHHPCVFLISLFALLIPQSFIHVKYTLNAHWDSWRRGIQGFVTAKCPAWTEQLCGSILDFTFSIFCVKTKNKFTFITCVCSNLKGLHSHGGVLIWCCKTATGGCGSFQWFTVVLILLQFRRMEKLSLSGMDRGQTSVTEALLVMISLSYGSKPLARATELWSKQTKPP